MNRGSSLTLAERNRLDTQFRELQAKVIPVVGDYMKATLPDRCRRGSCF